MPSVTFAEMNVAASTLWQTLIQWDQALFEKINSDWAHPFFDAVMPFLRNSKVWLPLYLFLLVLVLYNFGLKGLWWTLFFIITVALTDMTGNYVFKHIFERLRPCNDPEFASQVRLVLHRCGAGYSFISNHAANHFGMAAFFFITFRHIIGKWVWAGILWAAAIAYAQVYVGLHYPLDVMAGAIVGIVAGCALGQIFNKQFGFVIFDNQSTGSH